MNPIFLYENRLIGASLSASETAAGYNVNNLADYRTYTRWKALSPGTKIITVTLGSPAAVNGIGIAGHNLSGGVIFVDYDEQPALTETDINSNYSQFFYFTQRTGTTWEIKINQPLVTPEIGVIFLHNYLQMPQPPETPYSPFKEKSEFNSEISKVGHLLGNNFRFSRGNISARFDNLTRSFVNNNVTPFWSNHLSQGKPFFFAWDKVNAPDDVFYVRAAEGMTFETPVSILERVDSVTIEMEGTR